MLLEALCDLVCSVSFTELAVHFPSAIPLGSFHLCRLDTHMISAALIECGI